MKTTYEKNEMAGYEQPTPQQFCSKSGGYEIKVRDHLETYWFEWFEGWSVTNLEDGEVLLKSTDVDKSKLHGTLNKIRDLNLTLVSVACLPADEAAHLKPS